MEVPREKFANGVIPAFSPDGAWLSLGGDDENRVLDTRTWQIVVRWPRQASGLYGNTVFSIDNSLLLIQHTREDIARIRTGTWDEVLRLQSTAREALGSACIGLDSRWLAALGTSSEVWLWNMTELRRRLRDPGLDW